MTGAENFGVLGGSTKVNAQETSFMKIASPWDIPQTVT